MVKTHKLLQGDDYYTCACGRDAGYWSQNVDGEKPLGQCVFHCQACREVARKDANHILTIGEWGLLRSEIQF